MSELKLNNINVIEIIEKYSLTVRCLPYKTVRYLSYVEGYENRKWIDSNGKTSNIKRTLEVQNYDLNYFKNNSSYYGDKRTAEQRFKEFKKTFLKVENY